jgi:hypothetical protein
MTHGWLVLLTALTAGADPTVAQPTPDGPVSVMPQPLEAPVPPHPFAPPTGERDPAFHNTPPGMFGDRPDCETCFWVRADYLLWWAKSAPMPEPLVTTGSPTAAVPGGLSQPGTQVLFGETQIDYGAASGFHIDAGSWLDYDEHWGIGTGFFILQRGVSHFAAASDAGGHPILAVPLINAETGLEFTKPIARPGLLAGGASINTDTRLEGWDMTGVANLCRTSNMNLDLLAGFRVLWLDDGLEMVSSVNPLVAGALPFPGLLLNRLQTLTAADRFRASNSFYGFQLGARGEWNTGRLTLIGKAQVAVGDTQEFVLVQGLSSVAAPGAPTVLVPGGVLAVSSNVGRHFQDKFGIVPELGLEVSYRICCSVEAHLGYSFLYWNRVARPGDQIDRTVEPALIPTDPRFGTAFGTRPAFPFRNTDYWAQGLEVGLTFRF